MKKRILSVMIVIIMILCCLPVNAMPNSSLLSDDESIANDNISSEEIYEETFTDSVINQEGNIASISSTYETYDRNTIPDGIYAFKNLGNSNRWMDVQEDRTDPGYHMQQYAFSNESPADFYKLSGLFKVTQVGQTGRYIIRLMLNTNLTFAFSGNEVLTKQISQYDSQVSASDTFYITYDNGGYIIRPYSDSSYCISANNTTASGRDGAPDSYLSKRTLSSAGNRARWIVEGYQSNIPNGVYAFKNVGNANRWMDVQEDKTDPGYHIQQLEYKTSSPAETFERCSLFKVTQIGSTGRYTIRLMLNNRLGFKFSSNEVITQNIDNNDASVSSDCTFRIAFYNGNFVIRENSGSYCVSAKDTMASGRDGAPDSYLSKRTISSAGSRAMWTLEKYTVTKRGYGISEIDSMNTGDTKIYKVYTWSTVIGENTAYAYIANKDASKAESKWDEFDQKLEVYAHQPGNATINITIKKGTAIVMAPFEYQIKIRNLVEEEVYYIYNKDNNKYLQIDNNDSSNNYSTDGAIMELWGRSNADYQRWSVIHVKDGYYKIISERSLKALSVPSGKTDSSGSALVQETYNGYDRQLWKFSKTSRGSYVIRPKSAESKSTDWCMCAGSQFLGITNGLNVEQKAYTNDSNYKDEWILSTSSDFDMKFIGITNEKHNHVEGLQNAKNLLNNRNYNNIQIITGELSAFQCKYYIQNSKIFTIRSHGSSAIDHGTLKATFVKLDDDESNGNTRVRLYSHNCNMPTSSDCIKDDDYFKNSDLVLFIGCETAYGGENANNLPSVVVQKGAKVAIGFTESIDCPSANKWVEAFYENLLNGYTVKESAENALEKIEYEDYRLESFVICGDKNYRLGD